MNKKPLISLGLVAVALLFLVASLAEARLGGGRSSGSRGSRGSASSSPYRQSPGAGQSNPYRSPSSPDRSQSRSLGGGFMRSLGAGLLGGAIGSLLFGGLTRGLGAAGGGIGLLEALLFAGLAFLVFKWWRSRQQVTAGGPSYSPAPFTIAPTATMQPEVSPVDTLAMADSSFTVTQFNADRLDDFFGLQAAWANRDLTSVQNKVSAELFTSLSGDAAALKAQGQINKLDNIAIRDCEIVEAWTEPGRLYATVLFTANLVDYTVKESTGEIIAGSKSQSVKFSEYWTFVKGTGFVAENPHWRLSAIQQGE
jgi:predicted lipid-binding transport protein (Tim44 family)